MKLKKYLREFYNMTYKEYKELTHIEQYNIWYYHQEFCKKEQKKKNNEERRKLENWRPMTKEEKKYMERIFQKEKEKYERDSLCGGIDEKGNYTRLHWR